MKFTTVKFEETKSFEFKKAYKNTTVFYSCIYTSFYF